MKKMNINEFKKYIQSLNIKEILYDQRDQEWFDRFSTMPYYVATFERLNVYLNPNEIFAVTNKNNYIAFRSVKRINVDENAILGTKIDIICGDFDSADNDITYKMFVIL